MMTPQCSAQQALDVLAHELDLAQARHHRLEELEHVLTDIRAALGLAWSIPDTCLPDLVQALVDHHRRTGGTTHAETAEPAAASGF